MISTSLAATAPGRVPCSRTTGSSDWCSAAKLHAASTEQLESWTGRVLSATTLDEIFALLIGAPIRLAERGTRPA
jgi:hypothetical protein